MSAKNLTLKVIFDGLDRLTGPLKDIGNSSAKVRKEIGATTAQIGKLNDIQKNVATFKKLESALNATGGEIDSARQKVAELAAQMAATDAPTKKLSAEYAKAQRDLQKLEHAHETTGRELQSFSSKLSAAGVDVADLGKHEERLAHQVYDANDALRKQQAALDKVNQAERNKKDMQDLSGKLAVGGAAAVGAGMAIGAPIAVATKQAMNFESAMADVKKVVDFTSPQGFSKMSDDLLDLSTRIPIASEGLAQIAAAAGRSGIGENEILKFTEDAAKMGVAFDVSAEDAGAMMAKWRAAFGMGQEDVVGLADRVNALTNKFGGSADAVSDIITRIGPLGSVAGVTAPQVAAIGQLMNRLGVESEVAATGTKNMMLALTKGSAATKAQSKAFAALGLDAQQVAKRMQTDAGGAITDVMERLRKLPKEQQAGMLTQLFGSESVGAIAPMLTNLDQLKENLALVGDNSQYAGSMQKEFLARIATTEGATGLASNAVNALNIKMGQEMLPTVTAVSDKVKDLANGMRDWAEENPKLAKFLMIFAAVGAGLLIVLGGLALGFAALTAAAAPLGIALGPLLLIIAAVAALVAIGYLIYDNWDAIAQFFSDLWDTICGYFNDAIDGITNLFLNWTLLGLIISHWDEITNYLGGLWTKFQTIGGQILDGLIQGITNKLAAVKATITNAASSIANWFKEKLGIHSPSRVFAGLGGFVMEGLDQGLSAGASGPLSRVGEISSQLTRAMAIGTAAPALALSSPAMAASGAGGGSSQAMTPAATYSITINANDGNARDIAQQVRDAIEQIERERRGRTFGDDRDY